ncbi:MAG: rubrerythrin family protein [Haloarculaceae archaeon]
MDGNELVEAVRASKATELDRLGKEKALIAATDADLATESVLGAAAASERRAQRTLEGWAERESNDAAREAFERVAATEAEHYERVVAHLAEPPEEPEIDPLHASLRKLERTVERVGAGLVGRPLASERTLLQVVNFFVNEADTAAADLFRDLREETRETPGTGAALLEELCSSEDDWVLARKATEDAIRVVYDDYAETLGGMGLDPKPVC